MTIDTTDLIKALEERKRQLSKWTDKDRAKERIDEIDCIIDTDVPYLVKEESDKPVSKDLEEAAWGYASKECEKDAFIAGAKWDRSYMMEEAVPFYEILKVVPPGPERENVRIIIIKQD